MQSCARNGWRHCTTWNCGSMRSLYHCRLSQLVLLAILASILTACQSIGEVLPTPPPVRERPSATVDPIDESPRLKDSMEIPPTWTPSNDEAAVNETPIAPEEITPGADGQATYVVQPGDTLAGIALRYNVAIDDLAQANDIDDLDHIEAGQVLVIPGF
ncbi:MAG: LysM peptidoglycan-binding domain-containing protein [Chloroflexota bacterium]|nr:MAG: LysM peptidoglycan-binding domain-containing protein [Chloroflexota bacterium]